MIIQIESTTKIIELNGVPARVWEGITDSGIKVHAFITRIGIDKDETRIEEFAKELLEQKTPTPEIEAIPLRMIL
jgi:hypothetical protein